MPHAAASVVLGRLRRYARGFAAPAIFAALLSSPHPAAAQNTSHPPVPAAQDLALVWSRSVDPLITLAISPQGGYTGLITRGGKLALWNTDTGKSVWYVPNVTAHDIVVSDQMGYVLAYDEMNRLNPTVSLYRAPASVQSTLPAPLGKALAAAPEAKRIMKRTLDGAVWSAAVSMDGSHAACGTGSRQVYLFTLDLRPSVTPHPIDGLCNDLDFSANNQYVALGLWNQSGIETMDLAGRIRWSFLGSNTRRYEVSLSSDNRRVLALSYRNPNHSEPVLSLLNDQGSVLWSYDLGASAYGSNAQISAGSQITYASYTAIMQRGRDVVAERSLIALGPSGNLLWTQGGLFFKPTLLFIAPDGSGVIAYDGIQTLYWLSSHGSVTRRKKLPGQLEYWAVNRDRTRLVTYTSDGQLSAWRVR